MKRVTLVAFALILFACAEGLISGAIDDALEDLRLSECFGECNASLLICGDANDDCFANCESKSDALVDACETACTKQIFDCFEVWGSCGESCLAAAENALGR